jgi:hypothetical protein
MDKPIKRRIFVYAVRERQRMRTKLGLYLPNSSRGMLTRAEDVWVVSAADDCLLPWKKGQHILIADGFELTKGRDSWEENMDDPDFAKIKKFAEEVGGKVTTWVIHEDSVLAEVDGELFQEDVQW